MSRKPRHPHPDEVMRDAVAQLRRVAQDLAPTSPGQAKTVRTVANRLERKTRTPEPPHRGARP